MTIEELRDRLNYIIGQGYGPVNVIGMREQIDEDESGTPIYEWSYLDNVEICDRDGHGGAGLNLIMD